MLDVNIDLLLELHLTVKILCIEMIVHFNSSNKIISNGRKIVRVGAPYLP